MNKFPVSIPESESIASKVTEVKATVKYPAFLIIRFQLKKSLTLGTAFGRDEMTEDQLRQNLNTCISFLASLLKKGWVNISTLTIKTSMGHPVRIYG